MATGLLAGAEDGEVAGVFPRQRVCRERARRGGADRSDLGGVDHRHGPPVRCFEQQDDAEV